MGLWGGGVVVVGGGSSIQIKVSVALRNAWGGGVVVVDCSMNAARVGVPKHGGRSLKCLWSDARV